MLSAPLATEKPIETKETFSFDEFTYTNDECKYVIQLSLTEDHIVFKITENGENGVPSRKYVNEFTLEDLLSKSKLFKMFDSISETKELFNHVLTTNSYTINKSSNCLVFKFNLNSFKSEDISLSIAQLSLNEDIALNGLCNSVSNLNKKYIDYQSKYEQLKQTVELLEDRMERIIIEKKEVNDEWQKKYDLKQEEIKALQKKNKGLTKTLANLTEQNKKTAKASSKVKTEEKKEETQPKK